MQRIFLAIDIGASSGRHIVGIEADGALQTDEVYRFPNGVQRENGHLIWDIEGIFQHVKAGIKAGLEGLAGQIPGLVEIHVNINGLPSSNADLMLDTTFESAEALKGYSKHPAHVAVADSKVRPYYKNRVCLDYEV